MPFDQRLLVSSSLLRALQLESVSYLLPMQQSLLGGNATETKCPL